MRLWSRPSFRPSVPKRSKRSIFGHTSTPRKGGSIKNSCTTSKQLQLKYVAHRHRTTTLNTTSWSKPNPRPSMGLAYLPTLTPETTPTDRPICQSHGWSKPNWLDPKNPRPAPPSRAPQEDPLRTSDRWPKQVLPELGGEAVELLRRVREASLHGGLAATHASAFGVSHDVRHGSVSFGSVSPSSCWWGEELHSLKSSKSSDLVIGNRAKSAFPMVPSMVPIKPCPVTCYRSLENTVLMGSHGISCGSAVVHRFRQKRVVFTPPNGWFCRSGR